MLPSDSFCNEILGPQVWQSAPSHGMENFGNVFLLVEHDVKVQPVGESFIADYVTPENDLSVNLCRLHDSALQNGDGMDLVLVCDVQISDRLESIPHPYPVPGPEQTPATFGKLMAPWNYVWDTQVVRSDIYTRGPLKGGPPLRLQAVSHHRQRRLVQLLHKF